MTTDASIPRSQPPKRSRLTDEQITATVARLRMTEADRTVLQAQALAGNPSARFVVYAARRRTERNGKDVMTSIVPLLLGAALLTGCVEASKQSSVLSRYSGTPTTGQDKESDYKDCDMQFVYMNRQLARQRAVDECMKGKGYAVSATPAP